MRREVGLTAVKWTIVNITLLILFLSKSPLFEHENRLLTGPAKLYRIVRKV